MNTLILYESLEGHTAAVAKHVAKRLTDAGHTPTHVDTSDETVQISFNGVDRVILAAPVHERRHPRGFEVALAASTADIMAQPTLLLSVSLSAAFADGLDEAEDYIDELLMRTGFTPTQRLAVAGAVQPGSYDYFESQVLHHIVLHNRDYAPSPDGDVFTDWDALDKAVDGFMAEA